MKTREPFSVWSNIVFLIPLYLALVSGFLLHGFLILLVFIFSTSFHATKMEGPLWWSRRVKLSGKQKVYFWADIISAVVLILYNLFIFWQKDFPKEFFYCIPFVIIGFYFFFAPRTFKYDTTQGLWHIMAGIITILVVSS
jgi:hypothetical protein